MRYYFRTLFLMSPDGVGGASGSSAAPSPSGASTSAGASAGGSGGGGSPTPAPAAAPSPAPSPAAPAAPSGTTPSAASAAPAPDRGVRDYLREMGLADFAGQIPDDHAALQQLALAYQQFRQVQPLLPYAQQYAQYAGQFQQWMQQQAAQQQQAQRPKNPFGLPEFDSRLLQMVRQNPQTGQLEALPGAPHDAVQRVTDYAFRLKEAQERFWQDPAQFLGPMIQEMVRQQGQQLVQQSLGGYQEQVSANTFVQQNSEWLYQRDQSGNPLRNPLNGQPVLSPWGQRFAQYVQKAMQSGLSTVAAQQEFALGMCQRDALMAQQQAAAAQQQNVQQQQQFVAPGAAHNPNVGGSVQPPSPNGNGPSQQPSANLRERLTRRFKENGFQVPATV